MTGVSLLEFKEMTERVRPLWQASVEVLKKPQGRPGVLKTLEDKLMALLIYYRTYVTHEFLGHLCGLHNSNICRLFKKLEPFLGKRLAIKKDRTLTPDVVLKLLVDVTEQPIQRPEKKAKRKQTYSGKKKRHTRKTEIIRPSAKSLSLEFLSKDTNFMYAQFSKAMFEIDDSSNNIEPEMVFSSKVPISFRHNSKHFDFSEFMFNFGSKRGQPSIMAFVFR